MPFFRSLFPYCSFLRIWLFILLPPFSVSLLIFSFFSFCLFFRSFLFCSVSLHSLSPCFYISFIFPSYLLSGFHPVVISLCSIITNHTLCPPSGLVPEQTCQVEEAGPVAALAGCLEDEMSGTGCSAVAAR